MGAAAESSRLDLRFQEGKVEETEQGISREKFKRTSRDKAWHSGASGHFNLANERVGNVTVARPQGRP